MSLSNYIIYSTFFHMFHHINDIIHHYIQFLFMELQQSFLAKIIPVLPQNGDSEPLSKRSNMSETSNDFCYHPESFKKLVEMELPCNESVEDKLCWLRSQMIGNDAEFDSSVGRRKLVYADHTASGRSLCYNENIIVNHLLPFYGMSLCSFVIYKEKFEKYCNSYFLVFLYR